MRNRKKNKAPNWLSAVPNDAFKYGATCAYFEAHDLPRISWLAVNEERKRRGIRGK